MTGGGSYQEHPSGEASRTSRLLCVCVCVWTCVCACGCEYTRVYKYTCTHVCVPMETREQLWILLFLGYFPSSYFLSNRVSHWPGTDGASKDAGSLSPRSHRPSNLYFPRTRITGIIHSPNFFLAQVLRTLREVLVLALH